MVLRLLLVDDNAHFLTVAGDVLQREGLSVVAVASTGDEALRRAREVQPDVALVDIDLGRECGFDVARRLVEAADGNPSHVILISAYPEADFADLIDDSPAIGFVSKSDLSARAICELLAHNVDVGGGPLETDQVVEGQDGVGY